MKYTVQDLHSEFADPDVCLQMLVELFFPNGIFCVQCDRVTKHYHIKGRKVYACGKCRSQTSPLATTIYAKSRTPLPLWFHAIYLMSTNKAGVSAKQLEREIGVTYKTAWRMLHQIRKMMQPSGKPLEGNVELDETFVHPNPYKRSTAGKKYGYDARRTGSVIFGMVERGGEARVWHVRSAGERVLTPIITKNIRVGSVIHTDGYGAYRKLPVWGYGHRWTDHSRGQYYTPESSTQNVENLWSHFKRGIKGVYRHVSDKHLEKYAQEFAWRYSKRTSPSMFWALLASEASIPALRPSETVPW